MKKSQIKALENATRQHTSKRMKIMLFLAWSGYIFTRKRFGIRYFSPNYFIFPVLLIYFKGAIKPIDMGMISVPLPSVPDLITLHMWLCVILGSIHYIRILIRERKRIIIHTEYMGYPKLLWLFSKWPFRFSENTVKRFAEPLVVMLIAIAIKQFVWSYGIYLQLSAFAMLIIAHKQNREARARLYDMRDAEIESQLMAAAKGKQNDDEVFAAEEGKTFNYKDLMKKASNRNGDNAISSDDNTVFKAN